MAKLHALLYEERREKYHLKYYMEKQGEQIEEMVEKLKDAKLMD